MDGRAVELWTPPYFAHDVRKPAAKMFSHTSKLIEGNQRFERGQAQFHSVCKETLADLAKGQHPFATILGCSDSRVPPKLIFDANFGELFIVRVAGNVISPEVMGTPSTFDLCKNQCQ